MQIVVQKFGGSSLATPANLKHVAEIVCQTAAKYPHLVVVPSAMGDTTDDLLHLSKQVHPRPALDHLDLALACGEQLSAALLCMALAQKGLRAHALMAWQVPIRSDENHGNAKIVSVDARRIRRLLKQACIVVIPGFQAVSPQGRISTLGRGGSDTTAVAVAHALSAERCDIYSDVKGVFTSDPRSVPEARLLPSISSEEMLELASLGGVVLHNRAVLLAQNCQVPLRVLSTFEVSEGTMIPAQSHHTSLEGFRVAAVSLCSDETLLRIQASPQALTVLRQCPLTLFTQVGSEFWVCLPQDAKQKLYRSGLQPVWDEAVSVVSVIGSGILAYADESLLSIELLAKEGITILHSSSSENRLCFVLSPAQALKAQHVLHLWFFPKGNFSAS